MCRTCNIAVFCTASNEASIILPLPRCRERPLKSCKRLIATGLSQADCRSGDNCFEMHFSGGTNACIVSNRREGEPGRVDAAQAAPDSQAAPDRQAASRDRAVSGGGGAPRPRASSGLAGGPRRGIMILPPVLACAAIDLIYRPRRGGGATRADRRYAGAPVVRSDDAPVGVMPARVGRSRRLRRSITGDLANSLLTNGVLANRVLVGAGRLLICAG